MCPTFPAAKMEGQNICKWYLLPVAALSVAWTCLGEQDIPDTIRLGSPDSTSVSFTTRELTAKRKPHPLLAGAASAVLPGLGQVYCGQHVKGGVFFTTEVLLALAAFNRFNSYMINKLLVREKRLEMEEALSLMTQAADSLHVFSSYGQWYEARGDTSLVLFAAESLHYHQYYHSLQKRYQTASALYRLQAYDKHRSCVVFTNIVSWMTGCYVMNLLDALQSTGRFADDRPRNSTAAGLLSTVPFLGLGQLYNGSLSKAGVVVMTHGCLAMLSLNYHRLMRKCELRLAAIERGTDESAEYYHQWESRRSYAFRQRNTYLWYGLLFYFYGIFDAIVDAHLHDMPLRMQLQPDLIGYNDGMGIEVAFQF